jgi:hypothetical protein
MNFDWIITKFFFHFILQLISINCYLQLKKFPKISFLISLGITSIDYLFSDNKKAPFGANFI